MRSPLRRIVSGPETGGRGPRPPARVRVRVEPPVLPPTADVPRAPDPRAEPPVAPPPVAGEGPPRVPHGEGEVRLLRALGAPRRGRAAVRLPLERDAGADRPPRRAGAPGDAVRDLPRAQG